MMTAWLAALVFGLQLMYQSAGEPSCQGPGCKLHQMKNGTVKCCREVKCPAGHEATLCDWDSCRSPAKCIPCGPGYYQERSTMSGDMLQCEKHSQCSTGRYHLIVDRPGTTTSDVTCKCDIENGWYRRYPEQFACLGFKTCPPGKELVSNGTCQPCSHYSFFKAHDGTGSCVRKKDCPAAGFAYHSLEDRTRDNICNNVTSAAVTTAASVRTGEVLEGNKGLGTPALIGIILACITLIVIIVAGIIIVTRRRRRETSSGVEAPPLENKHPIPEESDSDSGNHSFTRQNSNDSVSRHLLNGGTSVAKHPGGSERPRIHLPPQRQGSDKSTSSGSIKTPDSGIVCSHLASDCDGDSEPTPSPGVHGGTQQQAPLPAQQAPHPAAGKKDFGNVNTIIVNGPNCHLHVGDKTTTIHYGSSEQLDTDGENVEYQVHEEDNTPTCV